MGVASKTFDGSGQNKQGRKEGKEKEAFYAFQKAEKQRKGKFTCTYFDSGADLHIQRLWI